MSMMTEFYLAVAVGLILSMALEEFFGISSGGVVAAGYLAMICDDFMSMAVVLLVSLLTYLVVDVPRLPAAFLVQIEPELVESDAHNFTPFFRYRSARYS